MEKIGKIKAIGITLLLLVSMLAFMSSVSAEGPNYIGFTPKPKQVTVGDEFVYTVYCSVSQQIDSVAMDEFTFTPAGVINYCHVTKGNLFGGQTMWITPEDDGTINNATGYADSLMWGHTAGANNTNKTAFNITWFANKCGTATITITEGGTALDMIDPGTTLYTGTVEVHPKYPTAVTATVINESQIDLTWTKQTGMDKTVIRYSIVSYPTTPSEGTLLYNDTGSSTSHTGIDSGQTVYYSAWGWNNTAGFYSLTRYQTSGKTNNPPAFTNPDPADNAYNIDKDYPQVSITINDQDGQTFNWTIQGDYLTPASANGATNGTKTATLNTPLPYNTNVIWYVNATDGISWTRAIYNFTTRQEYAPEPPSDVTFTATTINRFEIDLAWTPNDDYTYIEYSLVTGPWGRGAGTPIYNGTGSSYPHTSLDEGIQYFYQAWSYNATDHTYSSTFADADNWTVDDLQPVLSNEDPADNTPGVDKSYAQVSVDISDPEGDLMDWTIEGTYVTYAFGNGVGNGTIAANLTIPLPYDTNIIWYVNVTDGYESTNNIYNFTTRGEYAPTAPTDFDATKYNRTRIDLTWTPTDDYTLIEWNTVESWSIGEGTPIYNGTGGSFSHEPLDDGTTYYYMVWSYNATDHVWSLLGAGANATTDINHAPNQPTGVDPANGTYYESVYNEYLNVTVSDPDGDYMTVTFYWANDSAIAFVEDIANNSQASIFLPDYINPDWLQHVNYKPEGYAWYVIVEDQVYSGDSTQSASDYTFNTSKAWDLNEDKTVNYMDASGIVAHYAEDPVAGSIPADVNNDGTVNYLDASGVVFHYGEDY